MPYDRRFYGMSFTYTEYRGMPYNALGRSGLKVARVGLGTWKFGYPERRDGSRIGRDAAFAIMDRALELGVTFWDTANRYNESSGNSERVLGEWFRLNPGERRNIVLATKMGGAMDGETPNHCGLSRANILDSVYASLDRLGIDRIDLLQFHRVDPEVPVEESLEAVADLRRQDLVRYFGLSNVTVADLETYRRHDSLVRVCSVQNGFNPLTGAQQGQQGVLEYCAANGIAFIPFSPLLRGLLTDRYLPGRQPGPGDRLVDEGDLERLLRGDTKQRLARLAAIAAGANATVAQVCLAYLMQLPGMGPLIPSASRVTQLEENAGAAHLKLEAQTIESLREVFSVSDSQ